MPWRVLADLVLVVHLAFVVFVVVGAAVVWRWPRVAFAHVPSVVYSAVIELFGFRCPLTPLEKSLRRRAGETGYEGGFVEHYVVPVLYPGEFTTGTKIVLAVLIVTLNALAYALLWTRGQPTHGSPTASGTKHRRDA